MSGFEVKVCLPFTSNVRDLRYWESDAVRVAREWCGWQQPQVTITTSVVPAVTFAIRHFCWKDGNVTDSGWRCWKDGRFIGGGELSLLHEAKCQAAKDAQRTGHSPGYVAYLDQSAQEHHDYFAKRGDYVTANEMLTRTLAEALMGNDGE